MACIYTFIISTVNNPVVGLMVTLINGGIMTPLREPVAQSTTVVETMSHEAPE